MPNRAEMEALIRDLYAARVGNDLKSIERLFSDQADFEIFGSSPAAVKTNGNRNIVAMAGALMKTFVMSDLEIMTILIDGNRAAVHWRVNVRTPDGAPVSTDMIDILSIENGRVSSLFEICDSALAMQLAGPSPTLQMI